MILKVSLGMFQTFKTMERTGTVEWLSTHPLPDTRINNVQKMISTQYPDSYRLKQDSEKFHKIQEILNTTKESYELC